MIIPTTKCDHCEKTAVEMYTEKTAYGTYWSTYECDCGGVPSVATMSRRS